MGQPQRATMSTAARRPGRGSRRGRIVGGTWLLLALGLAVAKKRELPAVRPRGSTLVPAPEPVAEPQNLSRRPRAPPPAASRACWRRRSGAR